MHAGDVNRVIEFEAPKTKKVDKLHQDEEKDDGAIGVSCSWKNAVLQNEMVVLLITSMAYHFLG